MSKISFRSPAKQAAHATRNLKLESIGTHRNYEQALTGLVQFLQANRLGDLKRLTRQIATYYLEHRAEEVSQKTLDLDRQAIQSILKDKLPVIRSELKTALESRAYTPEQITLVSQSQIIKHSLATLIAHNAGLRAHELLTLRPVAERQADTHRPYRQDRFTGRNTARLYTVEGKGGLCREIAIDTHLAQILETKRLIAPQIVYDREVRYTQHYDLGGGKKWSDSFSKAAQRTLGWTTGAHGVRHTYAQERMKTLQKNGFNYTIALEIVSQEMGHFRPEITEVYLR